MSSVKGIYVLVVQVDKDINVNVGALGNVDFEKGIYAYVGSGQSNLEKRVQRHLKRCKPLFWHIDYLLENKNVEVLHVFCNEAGKRDECKIAKEIGRDGIAVAGFGSSDCDCKSHLFRVSDYQFLKEFMRALKV